jgi:hypothetical protein
MTRPREARFFVWGVYLVMLVPSYGDRAQGQGCPFSARTACRLMEVVILDLSGMETQLMASLNPVSRWRTHEDCSILQGWHHQTGGM